MQAEQARQQLLYRLITAQEEERRRIARELHDQMGQYLTGLLLGLRSLRDASYDRPATLALLQQLQQIADLLGQEAHQLALELRPTALDDLGLHSALAHYVDLWSARTQIVVDFASSGLETQRLPAEIETVIYRIVQETLTNVLKHAHATRVSLIVKRHPGEVVTIVEDNGAGFNVEVALHPYSPDRRLGLLGMVERAALVSGTLTIESSRGNGTSVFLRIPLAARDKEQPRD
jgi:signal transduction histidine kinase